MKNSTWTTILAVVAAALAGCQSGNSGAGGHPASAPAMPMAHDSAEVVDAKAALARLKAGNERFRSEHLRHPDQGLRRLLEVEADQHPYAVIVSCADSRVPPEIVFDEGLGDLFVIREAGHVADAATLGSIEYAVEHLHTSLVVVLGHERCGAVSAAAEVITQNARPVGHIVNLVDDIRPAVERAQAGPGNLIDKAVRANVDMVVHALRGSHPILFEHLAEGSVQIIGAVYDLHTGAIEWR